MGIPATTSADDVLATHAMVADDDVFGDAGFDVVHPRFAVGGGWSFIKNEWFGVVAVSEGMALDVVYAPILADAIFECDK